MQPVQEAQDDERSDGQAITPRQGGRWEDAIQATQGQEDNEIESPEDRHHESWGQNDIRRDSIGISF